MCLCKEIPLLHTTELGTLLVFVFLTTGTSYASYKSSVDCLKTFAEEQNTAKTHSPPCAAGQLVQQHCTRKTSLLPSIKHSFFLHKKPIALEVAG